MLPLMWGEYVNAMSERMCSGLCVTDGHLADDNVGIPVLD